MPPPPPDVLEARPPRAPRPRRYVFVSIAVALAVALAAFGFWFVTGTDIDPSSWAYEMTQITDLHARGLDGSGITVCIVDTGIDLTHPELQNAKLVQWRDFVNGGAEPYDDEGHGTAMAGIIFARGRLKGVAPNANLIAVKAISSSGSGGDTQVASAVTFCMDPDGDGDSTDDGAHVISLSLGGRAHPFLGSATEDAVGRALARGGIVVAAAGNDGQDDDGEVESPASVPRVIAVGAVDRLGVVASFSSAGRNGVFRTDPNKKPEVVAPGVEIATVLTDGRYGYVLGTSPAAALVSGIVALLLQPEDHAFYRHNPSAILPFKSALMDAAVEGQQLPHDDHYGYGIVQGFETFVRM